MSIVTKSYIFAIVRVDMRSGDNGTTKVSPNVLSNNCWITFYISTKGVKNKDKSWSKLFCYVVFMKHAKNNTLSCFKKKTKKFMVFKKEGSPQLIIRLTFSMTDFRGCNV